MNNEMIESDNNLVTIREMTTFDLKKCSDIFIKTYKDVYSEPWTQETGEKRIKEIFDANNEICFVAEEKNNLCGFIIARKFSWYDGVRIWIEELVVEKDFRCKGYGSLLFNKLKQTITKFGISSYSLLSKLNSNAYKYYLKRNLNHSNWVHLENLSSNDSK